MNLEQYIRKKDLSGSEVAKELGADPSLVSRWRKGEIKPSRKWWHEIQMWSRGVITEDVE